MLLFAAWTALVCYDTRRHPSPPRSLQRASDELPEDLDDALAAVSAEVASNAAQYV